MRALALCLLAAPSLGLSADYLFRALPLEKGVEITIELDKPARVFRMPAWAPGDYQIFDYGKTVRRIALYKDGVQIEAKRGDDVNRWAGEDTFDKVVYSVGESRGNFSPNLRVLPEEVFCSPAGVFGWVEGQRDEPHTLTIHKHVAGPAFCALESVGEDAQRAEFKADDYEHLNDSPFVQGRGVYAHEFQVAGKPHWYVAYGRDGVDLAAWADQTKPVIEAAYRLFGELPYPRFIFFADFRGPGGGLEHRDSTRLGVFSPQPGPAMGLVSHEFVHTFVVKRIRERPLGPFDFTKAPRLETLWWLEGVTDYYADLLRARAGQISNSRIKRQMDSHARRIAGSQQANSVSALESSARVWERPGSQGYGTSYYSKGKAIGYLLDLSIRRLSGGKASLDNVMRDLWEENRNGQPGYEPMRIRELCIKHGGEEMRDTYDQLVRTQIPAPADEIITAYERSGLTKWPR